MCAQEKPAKWRCLASWVQNFGIRIMHRQSFQRLSFICSDWRILLLRFLNFLLFSVNSFSRDLFSLREQPFSMCFVDIYQTGLMKFNFWNPDQISSLSDATWDRDCAQLLTVSTTRILLPQSTSPIHIPLFHFFLKIFRYFDLCCERSSVKMVSVEIELLCSLVLLSFGSLEACMLMSWFRCAGMEMRGQESFRRYIRDECRRVRFAWLYGVTNIWILVVFSSRSISDACSLTRSRANWKWSSFSRAPLSLPQILVP